MKVSTIGLDLAKTVFQVHGVDEAGRAVLERKLRRSEVLRFFARLEPCLIGMEACGSAHYWARELAALGHEVRLMPASYVKAYVKRAKNDAVDAEAACEAVGRPSMRFVPPKSAEQQAAVVPHRVRDLLIRQRTRMINSLRSQMAEFGLVAPRGRHRLAELVALLRDEADPRIPTLAREALLELVKAIDGFSDQLRGIDDALVARARRDPVARQAMTVPGVGPITASALSALVDDMGRFRSGRHFAAWLGIVAREHSTGGKQRLGRISKMGDRYLRRLLVLGGTSSLRLARNANTPLAAWTRRMLDRGRPPRLVSVALANKTARHLWAVLAKGQPYQPQAAAA